MPRFATRIRSLGDALIAQGEQLGQDAPFDALVGFVGVVQFSHGLLSRQVIRSLRQHSQASSVLLDAIC